MRLKNFVISFIFVFAPALGLSETEIQGLQETEPIKIGALFAVTGPASSLGAPEAKTAEMFVNEINSKGGIHGRKIKLLIKDTGGSPEKALSFAKRLIEDEKVFAIIGPSTSGETMKIKNICEEAKTILFSCAAAETIINPVAKYVFKSSQKDSDAARSIFATMNKLGIKTIGIVSSNTDFGKDGKDQLEKIAPEYGINIVMSEIYDKDAADFTDLFKKLKSKKIQAVVNWSIGPAQATVAKNMKQFDFKIPLFQSYGFGNILYAKAAGKAAEGIIFPCGRLPVADALPDSNQQKPVLLKYKKDYETSYKEEAGTSGGYAYDALLILTSAIEKTGTDKEKVRDTIEGIKDFTGTAGIFNFSPEEHNGLGIDAFVMLTVKNGKFALYTTGRGK